MKCEIISDLLPIYIDGIASEQSKVEIEEHLKTCSKCNVELTKMRQTPKISLSKADVNMVLALKKIKKKFFRKNVIAALTSVVVVITILFGIWNFILVPEKPIVYENGLLSIQANTVKYIVKDNMTYTVFERNGKFQIFTGGDNEKDDNWEEVTNTADIQEYNILEMSSTYKTACRSSTNVHLEENEQSIRYVFVNFTENILSEMGSDGETQYVNTLVNTLYDESSGNIDEDGVPNPVSYDRIEVYYIDQKISDVNAQKDYEKLRQEGTLIWSGSLL